MCIKPFEWTLIQRLEVDGLVKLTINMIGSLSSVIFFITLIIIDTQRIHVFGYFVEMLHYFSAEMSVEMRVVLLIEMAPYIGNVMWNVKLHQAVSFTINCFWHAHFDFVFLDLFIRA